MDAIADKICPKCGNTFPATTDNFHKDIHKKDGLYSWCKKCSYKYKKAGRRGWVKKHKSRIAQYSRNYRKIHGRDISYRLIQATYGLTKEQYDQMIVNQRGLCAVCEINSVEVVDHDHDTGVNRELLCHRCNRILGNINEDVEILVKMIEYLNKHKLVKECY